MAAYLPAFFYQQFFYNGAVAAGQVVYIYETGTSTPKTVYTDQAGTIPYTQPIALDANGRPENGPFWILSGECEIRQYTAPLPGGALVDTFTDVAGAASAGEVAAFALDLADATDPAKGLGMMILNPTLSYVQGTLGWRESRRVDVTDFPWLADPTGVNGAADAIQAAIDWMTSVGGGEVYGRGVFKIDGTKFVNIKANVRLQGAGGGASRMVSESGGVSANHALVYLKDGAEICDFRLSGSDYVKQNGGASFTAWQKVGITTQGSTANGRHAVRRVGFEKLTFSHVYTFSNTSDMVVEDCYTFGQQHGAYVDVDASGLVTNWTATTDSVKLAAGTQAYALTNFYNSGGSSNVTITRNVIKDINDSFIGHNAGSGNHVVTDNVCIKSANFYGGFGLDCNGGSELKAWGNQLEGFSYGAYIHDGSVDCVITDNLLKAAHGIVFEGNTSTRNKAHNNDVFLVEYGVNGRGAGVSYFAGTGCDIEANTLDCGSNASTSFTVTGAVDNGTGLVRLTIGAHSLKRRQMVKVSGVTGTTEANGVWEILPASGTEIDLLRSAFVNAYVAGGTADVGTMGVAVSNSLGSTSSGNRAPLNKVRNARWGVISKDGSNSIEEFRTRFESVTTAYDGAGSLNNRLTYTRGISGGQTPCNNLCGSVTISAGATSAAVVFQNAEPKTSYLVLLSVESVSGAPVAGGYPPLAPSSKTTSGFTVNIAADPGGATSITYSWMLTRS